MHGCRLAADLSGVGDKLGRDRDAVLEVRNVERGGGLRRAGGASRVRVGPAHGAAGRERARASRDARRARASQRERDVAHCAAEERERRSVALSMRLRPSQCESIASHRY